MKKETKVMILVIGVLLVVILIIGFFSYTKKPVCGNGIIENRETSENCCIDVGCVEGYKCIDNKCMNFSVAPAPIFDRVTIEATILNLSTEMVVVNNAGINGTLHGKFAKARVDKIINHTRYDPRGKLEFSPLITEDIMEIVLPDESDKINVGSRVLVNIERGFDSSGIWLVREYNILQ